MALSLTTQAGLLTASRAMGQVLNAVVGIVIVRFLTQHDYGTFRQIYLLYATLLLVTDVGMPESLFYFLPRQPEWRKTLILRSVLVVGVAQVVVGVALVAGEPWVSWFFSNPDLGAYLGLLAIYLGTSVVTRLWEVQLICEQRAVLASVVTGGFEALKVGLMFVALVVVPGVSGLLWALVASTVLKFFCYVWFLLREFRWFAGMHVSKQSREQYSYAAMLFLPAVVNIAAMQAHQFIVGFSFTTAEYALYSVACFQVPLVGVLTTSIIEVMLVRITAARAQGREGEVLSVWASATKKSQMIFIPMTVGLTVLSGPLITLLFTPRYAAAAPLFAVLMAALPLNGIFTNNALRAYGAMGDYAKFYAAKFALGLGLGVAGVTWFGMWGAAVSSVLALYMITGFQLVRVAKLLRVSWGDVLPWSLLGKITAAGALAAVPAAACAMFLKPPALALFLGLVLYGSAYVVLLVRFRLTDWSEMRGLTYEMMRFLRPATSARTMADGVANPGEGS